MVQLSDIQAASERIRPLAKRTPVMTSRLLDEIGALGRALHDDAGTAFIHASADGAIVDWNAGAENLFGHRRADVLGRAVDLIVPAPYREAHWAGFHRAMKGNWRGAAGWGPIEALHASGASLTLEVFLTPLRDQRGVAGILALFRAPA